MDKDVYIFRFETAAQAEYWMGQTLIRFSNDIVTSNKFKGLIEFDDSIYYFWTNHRVGGNANNAIEYTVDELSIILGDTSKSSRKRPVPFQMEEGDPNA